MAKKNPARNDSAQFEELIRLPGTPESRQADHDLLQVEVAANIGHVRSAIGKILDAFRRRFKLPQTKGTDSQLTAAIYVLHQAQHLQDTLLRIPRSQWANGTFHECPPTLRGEIVATENRDDFVLAMEYLRQLAAKVVGAANQLTTIPPSGLPVSRKPRGCFHSRNRRSWPMAHVPTKRARSPSPADQLVVAKVVMNNSSFGATPGLRPKTSRRSGTATMTTT